MTVDREVFTERLHLRPFAEDDRAQIVAFYGNAEVMAIRKLGVLDVSAAERQLQIILDHWRAHGFGIWAMMERASGCFAGECGLRWADDGADIELTYGVLPAFRGRGYATEAARAALAYGFEALSLHQIVAMARGDNAASHHVLEKCGMTRVWFRANGAHGLVRYDIQRTSGHRRQGV